MRDVPEVFFCAKCLRNAYVKDKRDVSLQQRIRLAFEDWQSKLFPTANAAAREYQCAGSCLKELHSEIEGAKRQLWVLSDPPEDEEIPAPPAKKLRVSYEINGAFR